MNTPKLSRGYSLTELLGVVAIICLLALVAIPSYLNFNKSARIGVALRNASMLNSAIEQYNQAGGLMTAQVPMAINTSSTTDGELAEVKVFCRLASSAQIGNGQSGPFVSPVQRPLISRSADEYRVVWISGVQTGSAYEGTYNSATGVRNPALEKALAAGTVENGRFLMVGPGEYPENISTDAPGIAGLSRDGVPCTSALIAGLADGDPLPPRGSDSDPEPSVTPIATPPLPPGTTYTLALSVSPASGGSITYSPAKSSYSPGEIVNYSAAINGGYTARNWSGDMAGKPISGQVQINSNVNGTLYVQEEDQTTLSLSISPAAARQAGAAVSGTGKYDTGSTASFSATGANGWTFTGWSGGFTSSNSSGTVTMTQDVQATANFAPAAYILTLLETEGGVITPDVGAYTQALNDRFPLAGEAIFTETWDQPRYRWDRYDFDYGNDNILRKTDINFTHTIDGTVTVQPVFIQQFYMIAETPDETAGHTLVMVPHRDDLYDKGTTVQFHAINQPATHRFLRWSDGSTAQYRTETVSKDTRLTAFFTDRQVVFVRLIDETGAELDKAFYNLAGLTPGKSDAKIGSNLTFIFATLNNAAILSASGADFAGQTGTTLSGGKLVTSDAPVVITIQVRVPRITFYWNEQVTPGSEFSIQNSGTKYIPAAAIEAMQLTGGNALLHSIGAHTVQTSSSYGEAKTEQRTDYSRQKPSNWAKNNPDHEWNPRIWTSYQRTVTVVSSYSSGNAIIAMNAHDRLASGINTGLAGAVISTQQSNGVFKSGAFVGKVSGYIFAQSPPAISNYAGDWSVSGSGTWCPLVIEFGTANFLAGENNWRNGRTETTMSAVRNVNLDGTGTAMWEWIGPSAGLLYLNPKSDPNMQPKGSDFFGNSTFGKEWADGFAPLATLDKNRDGKLTDSELKDIWVWVDNNSNAVLDPGEGQPLTNHGLDTLFVTAEKDNQGGLYKDNGATGVVGKFRIVDWWSVKVSQQDLLDIKLNNDNLSTYEWEDLTGKYPGGVLKFFKVSGAYKVWSIPNGQSGDRKQGVLFDVIESEGELCWYVDMDNAGLLLSALKVQKDGSLTGDTKIYAPNHPLEVVKWTAKHTSGDTLDKL